MQEWRRRTWLRAAWLLTGFPHLLHPPSRTTPSRSASASPSLTSMVLLPVAPQSLQLKLQAPPRRNTPNLTKTSTILRQAQVLPVQRQALLLRQAGGKTAAFILQISLTTQVLSKLQLLPQAQSSPWEFQKMKLWHGMQRAYLLLHRDPLAVTD